MRAQIRREWSGFDPWPGTLCCVLGQDTTLTVPFSTQVYKWVPAEKLPVASCYGNRDKLRHDGPLGPNADFTYLPVIISRNIYVKQSTEEELKPCGSKHWLHYQRRVDQTRESGGYRAYSKHCIKLNKSKFDWSETGARLKRNSDPTNSFLLFEST